MTIWDGCYNDSWRDEITPESFAHPAKMARGLVRRIFDELALPRGAVVVDPFGGVGTTGIEASSRGLQFFGCELEEKFYQLALDNFAKHRRTWEAFKDPLPVMVHGDSRQLRANLSGVMADVVVGSPPFCDNLQQTNKAQGRGTYTGTDLSVPMNRVKNDYSDYGQTEGQLGNLPSGSVDAISQSETSTFWSAANEIVRECHAILRPGGLAVWVCKDFVRKGARVPFSDDWRRLCVSNGFELVQWVQSSLVAHDRHPSLFGGEETKTVSRKSFFRRIAERKGSPEINEEDVLIMRKGEA